MKYAHLADIHLGSWREDKMRTLSTQTFLTAIDRCIQEKVDFILFSGDIFNTSLPALDTLKIVTKKLKELQDRGIPVYAIAGSHDFSPSGKTMIEVLEHAGLLKNVCKGSVVEGKLRLNFTIDPKTNAKITGIIGRKGQLDKFYYQNLSHDNLEQESGYKIFMFHTTISELKPKHLEKIDSEPVSFLPKGFNYYAGGHIHHRTQVELLGYGTLTYPGALFPNNFSEIEKYGHGGFYIVESNEGSHTVDWVPIKTMTHIPLILNCNHKTPSEIQQEIESYFKKMNCTNSLITLHLHGTIAKGKVSDLNFAEIFEELYQNGAYFVMKNTSHLTSEEFEEITIAESNPEIVEEQLIKEHLQQIRLFDREMEFELTKTLLTALNTTKKEGETVTDFQKRIDEVMKGLLEIEK